MLLNPPDAEVKAVVMSCSFLFEKLEFYVLPLFSNNVVVGAATEYSPIINFFYPLSMLCPKTADAAPLTFYMLELR